jgi:hypothetical protein
VDEALTVNQSSAARTAERLADFAWLVWCTCSAAHTVNTTTIVAARPFAALPAMDISM